ncbi:MAG TPA: hypothetical protein VHP63_01640 [candidate division Zixibacteria bacterium]|nr:hypothetical protein [candidate division Zixibacteria bacterium]
MNINYNFSTITPPDVGCSDLLDTRSGVSTNDGDTQELKSSETGQ